MNPIQRHFNKHGSFPTATLRLSGRSNQGRTKRKLSVTVNRGYIDIMEGPNRIYIPRKQLYVLLKWLVPLAKLMDEDFDPRAAMIDYMKAEEEHLRGMRQLKKSRGPQ